MFRPRPFRHPRESGVHPRFQRPPQPAQSEPNRLKLP